MTNKDTDLLEVLRGDGSFFIPPCCLLAPDSTLLRRTIPLCSCCCTIILCSPESRSEMISCFSLTFLFFCLLAFIFFPKQIMKEKFLKWKFETQIIFANKTIPSPYFPFFFFCVYVSALCIQTSYHNY